MLVHQGVNVYLRVAILSRPQSPHAVWRVPLAASELSPNSSGGPRGQREAQTKNQGRWWKTIGKRRKTMGKWFKKNIRKPWEHSELTRQKIRISWDL